MSRRVAPRKTPRYVLPPPLLLDSTLNFIDVTVNKSPGTTVLPQWAPHHSERYRNRGPRRESVRSGRIKGCSLHRDAFVWPGWCHCEECHLMISFLSSQQKANSASDVKLCLLAGLIKREWLRMPTLLRDVQIRNSHSPAIFLYQVSYSDLANYFSVVEQNSYFIFATELDSMLDQQRGTGHFSV